MHTLSDALPRLQFPDWICNLDQTIAVRYHADRSLWVLDMNTGKEYPAQSFDEAVVIVGEFTASQSVWISRGM